MQNKNNKACLSGQNAAGSAQKTASISIKARIGDFTLVEFPFGATKEEISSFLDENKLRLSSPHKIRDSFSVLRKTRRAWLRMAGSVDELVDWQKTTFIHIPEGGLALVGTAVPNRSQMDSIFRIKRRRIEPGWAYKALVVCEEEGE